MALILYREKKVIFRIAFVGIPFAGKSTLMKAIWKEAVEAEKGGVRQEFVENDRLLTFDILSSGTTIIPRFKTHFHLITLPGYPSRTQPYRQFLKGIDSVFFVIDSQWDRMSENVNAFYAFQEILAMHKTSLREVPSILVYNKRDISETAPLEYLESTFNDRSVGLPTCESQRGHGRAVVESYRKITQQLIRRYPQQENL